MEKFKTCICIIHASTQTGIVDACLLDSFTCFLHFLPLKGLEKETTQTADKQHRTFKSFLSLQVILE